MTSSNKLSFRHNVYIDGHWVPADSTADHHLVYDSNTSEVMGSVPNGSSGDADRAVEAARRAFDDWSRTPVQVRADWLRKISVGLQARQEELIQLIGREVGTPVSIATKFQVCMPIANWSRYADLAGELQKQEWVGNSVVFREPVGVVVAITPWNFPLNQITQKVAPALLAGCTVILKPSEVAPLNAFVLAEVIDEVGLPSGVFNLVTGDGSGIGEALVAHADVDCISFTGSTRAGKRIAEVAAKTVKRVRLELGGKSASVVLPGADLRRAVVSTMESCFLNSGQICVGQTRLLVARESLEEVCELARTHAQTFRVGRAHDVTTRLGPLVSQMQQDRVQDAIAQAIHEGATLISGGFAPFEQDEGGYFVRPTVFLVDNPEIAVAKEEVFGPVLTILAYDSVEDALRIANDSPYGLGGAVWASTTEEALAVAKRMRTGQVKVNDAPFNPDAPFGGYKQSGYGREGGRFGLEEFLEIKAVHMPLSDVFSPGTQTT